MNFERFIPKFLKIGKYPVRVIVLQRRGKALRIRYDRARRITRKFGVDEYELFNDGERIPPPSYGHMFLNRRGQTMLIYYEDDKGEYYPVGFKMPEKELEPIISKDIAFWRKLKLEEEHKKIFKPSWFEKYGIYTITAILCVLMLLTVILTWRNLSGMAESLSSMAKALKTPTLP